MEWCKKKIVSENSALYRRQCTLTSSNIVDINTELDKEFCNIYTALSIGQKLFRDTKREEIPTAREEIPTASSQFYMPTSIIHGAYLAGYEYDITLILTIKSFGIKCHYYGDSESACEWEVLLQKGLIFTKTNEYIIPTRLMFENECIREGKRTIMEFNVTTQWCLYEGPFWEISYDGGPDTGVVKNARHARWSAPTQAVRYRWNEAVSFKNFPHLYLWPVKYRTPGIDMALYLPAAPNTGVHRKRPIAPICSE